MLSPHPCRWVSPVLSAKDERRQHYLLRFYGVLLSTFRRRTSSGSYRGDRRVPLPVSKAVCSRFCFCRPWHPARHPVSDLQHLQRQRPVSRQLKTVIWYKYAYLGSIPVCPHIWLLLKWCFYHKIMRIDGLIKATVRALACEGHLLERLCSRPEK